MRLKKSLVLKTLFLVFFITAFIDPLINTASGVSFNFISAWQAVTGRSGPPAKIFSITGTVKQVNSYRNQTDGKVWTTILIRRAGSNRQLVVTELGGLSSTHNYMSTSFIPFTEGESVVLKLASVNGYNFLYGKNPKRSLSSSTFRSPLTYKLSGPKWADSALPVKFYINRIFYNWGSGGRAATSAFRQWENDRYSYLDYTYRGVTDYGGNNRDDRNTVSWGTVEQYPQPASARCYYYYDYRNYMLEFDIVMDNRFSWSFNGAPGTLDVQGILTHEVGHTLALSDLFTTGKGETMSYLTPQLSLRTIAGGDRAGMRRLYRGHHMRARPVSNLRARSEYGRITLTWRNPSVSYYKRTRILESTRGYARSPRPNSVQRIVYDRKGRNFRDYRVANNRMYYYTIFEYYSFKSWSSKQRIRIRGKMCGVGGYEDDDSIGRARTAETNTTLYSHTIYPAYDVDYRKFWAEAGSFYIMETLGETDTYLTLYNNGGVPIVSDNSRGPADNARIDWTAPSSNYYYIRVRHNQNRIGPYMVFIAKY